MAATKHIACGAIEHDATCPRYDTYTGTAEALIEAGLIRADQLPGLPGVNKGQRTFMPDGRDVHKGQNYRYLPGARRIVKRGRRFAVDVVVDEDEQKRRLADRHAQLEADREQMERDRRLADKVKQAREAGMTLEEWALRGIPKSKAEFLERRIGSADAIIDTLRSFMSGEVSGGGYSFEPAVLARFDMLAGRLRALIAGGAVRFDQAAHERAITNLLAEAGISEEPKRQRPALRLVH